MGLSLIQKAFGNRKKLNNEYETFSKVIQLYIKTLPQIEEVFL